MTGISVSHTHFLFQKYYHGENIAVNVLVDNNTNKTVKKIKISGEKILSSKFLGVKTAIFIVHIRYTWV